MLEQVIAGVQDADDVVFAVGVNGDTGIPFRLDRREDFIAARILRYEHDGPARGHNVLGGHSVELENIFDVFNIILIQTSFVGARVQHQDDVLLRNRFVFLVRIDAEQAEHAVGRHGQQPDDGLEHDRKARNRPAHRFGQLILMLHRHALGHKLAEHEGEEGKDQRNHDDRGGVDRADMRVGDGKRLYDKAGQLFRKVVGRKCGAQKAREGNADLDGGQEARRLLYHFQHLDGFLIAVLGSGLDFLFIQRDDRDFRRGEESV